MFGKCFLKDLSIQLLIRSCDGGNRRHSDDLPQGGMKISCKLIYTGETVDLTKIKKVA